MVSNGLGCPLGKGHLTLRGVLTYEWMSFFTCPCTPKFSLLPAYTVSFSLTCLRDSLAHISALTYAVLRFSDILKCTFQKWNLCFFFFGQCWLLGAGRGGQRISTITATLPGLTRGCSVVHGFRFLWSTSHSSKKLEAAEDSPALCIIQRKLRHRGGLLVLAWKRSGFFQS